jgi:hypothetical protein
MTKRPVSKRGHRLTMLAAKSLLCILFISLLLVWLGFGQGTGSFGSAVRKQFSRSTGFCLDCKSFDVDTSLPFVKSAVDAADVPSDLENQARTLATRTGVQIQLDGEDFHFVLYVKKQRLELFRAPATAEGLTAGAAAIDAAIGEKIKELAQVPYFAAVAGENELVEKQKSLDKHGVASETEVMILARQARLGELYGIEAALARSNPSYLARGKSTGIKFYFLKDALYKEESHFAYFTTDKDGRAAIYITAGTTDKLQPTELDAPVWAAARRFNQDGTFFDTVESLIMHELAHNHQARMGWNDAATTDGQSVRARMTEATGFASYTDSTTQQTVYLIKTKGDQYFRLDSRSTPESQKRWFRSDKNGQFLDATGAAVDNQEIESIAVIRPSSHYFDTPDEIFAEALKALRMGGAARQSLITLSPKLYALVKEEDQKEINLAYGYISVVETRTLHKGESAAAAGENKNTSETSLAVVTRVEPVMMRGWDGTLVTYSAAAADSLAQAEKAASTV